MGIVLQYRFLHHPVRKNYTTEITWPCKRCLCSIRPVCDAFSFSQALFFQGFGLLRLPSFYQYSIPRQSAAVTESRHRFYRCVLQGSSRRRDLSALIGSRLCGLRWLKIFLSLFPPWNFLFVLLQSYLHQLLSNGYVILPSTFQAEKTQWVQPKIFIPTLIQRKKSYGIQPKNLSPHFSCRFNYIGDIILSQYIFTAWNLSPIPYSVNHWFFDIILT